MRSYLYFSLPVIIEHISCRSLNQQGYCRNIDILNNLDWLINAVKEHSLWILYCFLREMVITHFLQKFPIKWVHPGSGISNLDFVTLQTNCIHFRNHPRHLFNFGGVHTDLYRHHCSSCLCHKPELILVEQLYKTRIAL